MRGWFLATIVGASLFGLLHLFQGSSLNPSPTLAFSTAAPIPSDALRIRIIANSNSAQDQKVKLDIRDRVLTYLNDHLPNDSTREQTTSILKLDVSPINHLVETVLLQHRMSYRSTTTFGLTEFPQKFYGNRIYPAGEYEALRIVLGKGHGHNWWCVIFPQLCYDSIDVQAVARTGAFPQSPPLAITSTVGPNGKRIPVQLRLAFLDYGQEWLPIVEIKMQQLLKKLSL